MISRLITSLTLLMLFIPSVSFGLVWESPPSDKSIEFLGMLFGSVGSVLVPMSPSASVMGALFKIFNVVLLSMGSIVLAYIIWISSIETAGQGELLGKKWSLAWIPLRGILGVGLLLPTPSGYSLSQLIMMWIIMHGVNAGNTLWSVLLESYEAGSEFNDIGDSEVNHASLAAQSMFESLMCKEMLEQRYPDALAELGGALSIYEYQGSVVIGVQDHDTYHSICGGLTPSEAPSGFDDNTWEGRQLLASEDVAALLSPYAAEAVEAKTVSGSDVIMSGRRTISSIIASTPKGDENPVSLDNYKRIAKDNGWLYAGSYYHQFSTWKKDFSPESMNAPAPIKPDYENLPSLFESNLKAFYTAYLKESDLFEGDEKPPTELDLSRTQGMSGNLALFWDKTGLTNLFIGIATTFIDSMNERDTDPLIALQKLGIDLMLTVETSFYLIIGGAFAIALIACVQAMFLPFCWMFKAGLSVIIPIMVIFLLLLWSAGVMLGLYIPLIPFLVFTFTAFTWFIYVVEAMVAAPVAALGITNPSAENFGHIQPVILLTLNLFLRPSLMIIGFIAAERILRAIMFMINFGYSATLEASLTGVGIFGSIVLVVLYAGIVTIAVKECFSLIHILPERVIRWIGGHIERSNVDENLNQAKSYLDKGAETSASIMKGGLGAVSSIVADKPADNNNNKDDDDDTKDDENKEGEDNDSKETENGDDKGSLSTQRSSPSSSASSGELGASTGEGAGGAAAGSGGAAAGGSAGGASAADAAALALL